MNDLTRTPKASTPVRSPGIDLSSPVGWLRSEIDRLFEDFNLPGRSLFDFAGTTVAPVPALEMTDTGKEYRLTAELPGLTDKDVEISVADGALTISGEKKEETERQEKGFMLNERRYGQFSRQVALPNDVDPQQIRARFRDGVLTVTMAKDEKIAARTRKIAIEG